MTLAKYLKTDKLYNQYFAHTFSYETQGAEIYPRVSTNSTWEELSDLEKSRAQKAATEYGILKDMYTSGSVKEDLLIESMIYFDSLEACS